MAPLKTATAAALLSLSLSALAANAPAPTITAAPSPAKVLAARAASESAPPLTEMTYAYSAIPYQVNPYNYLRGPQTGYNICNSTTAGDDSMCQTLIMNDIDDFCLWGSPKANGAIGDVEAEVVAYCTPKDLHGSRGMPAGTITGVQWITTSAYIQITGFLNQTGVGLLADDTGGELDPHGADLLGNPLGGLVYSTNLDGGDNKTYVQAKNWNNFVGSGAFCMKLCFNSVTSPDYCENTFDLLGCQYNMPSANNDGEFLKCDGDLQDPVGTYTGTDGKTSTWSQPSSLPATSTLPWTPRVPASSNCVTYKSEDLFGAASTSAAATSSGSKGSKTSSGAGATGSVSPSGSPSSGAAGLNAREVAVGLSWVGAAVAAVAGAAAIL